MIKVIYLIKVLQAFLGVCAVLSREAKIQTMEIKTSLDPTIFITPIMFWYIVHVLIVQTLCTKIEHLRSKILGSSEMYIYNYLFVAGLDNLNKFLEEVLVPGDVCVDTGCQTKGSFAGALLGIWRGP